MTRTWRSIIKSDLRNIYYALPLFGLIVGMIIAACGPTLGFVMYLLSIEPANAYLTLNNLPPDFTIWLTLYIIAQILSPYLLSVSLRVGDEE